MAMKLGTDCLNPTLDAPPPGILCSRALNIDLTIIQFIFYSYNVRSECTGLKGCPRKKLECDFWGGGQNPKVQIAKKKFQKTY